MVQIKIQLYKSHRHNMASSLGMWMIEPTTFFRLNDGSSNFSFLFFAILLSFDLTHIKALLASKSGQSVLLLIICVVNPESVWLSRRHGVDVVALNRSSSSSRINRGWIDMKPSTRPSKDESSEVSSSLKSYSGSLQSS